MKSYLAAALVAACLALACAQGVQDAFHVNDGSNSCVPASIGDCVPCTEQGAQYSVRLVSFEFGKLIYNEYTDGECQDYATTLSRGPSMCSNMPSCGAAPAGFLLFEVEAMSPLKVSFQHGGVGVVSMNATSAHAFGTLELFTYIDANGNSVRYQASLNGTIMTTAGPCPYDEWCSSGGGELSYRMATFPFGPEFEEIASEVTDALYRLAAKGDPMVDLVLETATFALSTTGSNVFVLGPNGPSVPASKLPTVVLEFPVAYTMTNMEVDTSTPTLSATVEWNGLGAREREFACDFSGQTSFDDTIIECSFSLPFQATDEPRMFASYADEAWDEQAAFALFE